jgi:hypothetical protein
VADAGYDGPRLAFLLADLPVVVLVRMRSDRVLRRATQAQHPGTRGRPRRHGGEFVFGDPATWGASDVTTHTDTLLYGAALARAWDGLHPRSVIAFTDLALLLAISHSTLVAQTLTTTWPTENVKTAAGWHTLAHLRAWLELPRGQHAERVEASALIDTALKPSTTFATDSLHSPAPSAPSVCRCRGSTSALPGGSNPCWSARSNTGHGAPTTAYTTPGAASAPTATPARPAMHEPFPGVGLHCPGCHGGDFPDLDHYVDVNPIPPSD